MAFGCFNFTFYPLVDVNLGIRKGVYGGSKFAELLFFSSAFTLIFLNKHFGWNV